MWEPMTRDLLSHMLMIEFILSSIQFTLICAGRESVKRGHGH